MDKIEALGSSIAQISLYDIKSYYNQAKAVVLNYTEMEAKVRDATNDDPWGASSTTMQEIAQGTFNFQQFNEIMPTIYKRFTEKEAAEWRQIYKALQLLEYLIKHGSERVIDDARSHISMIKILRNFHYVDDKGKDQGINVRNRAKEIAELLSDLDRVRQERRKAKAAKNKYIGVGSEGPSFTSSGGSKYGGFGSDSLGGGGGGGGGDDWNGGGSSSREQYTSGSSNFKQSDDFEEYDAGEWEDRPAPSASRTSPSTTRASISSNRAPSLSVSMKKPPPPKATAPPPKAKEVDLFSMDDDDDFGTPQAAPSTTNAANTQNVAVSLDDDFDDFQSAPPASNFGATSPSVASGVSSTGSKPNVFALLNATSSTPATQMSNTGGSGMFGGNNNMNSMSSQPMPTNTNNMFGGSSMMQPMIMNNNGINNNTQGIRPGGQYNNTTAMSPNTTMNGNNNRGTTNTSTSKPPVDSFDDLFSFAGLTTKTSSNANSSNTGNNGQPKLSMAAMAREQSSASIWGSAPSKPQHTGMGAPLGSAAQSGQASMSNNNDDLLL
ncbi:hypothetical protein Pst134EB_002156 [Puccinia striiformis f. sp. tritici]|uniref:ENTH domain-containing protein n=1 Tax=Puccinia striiformis f. sp. tritici PST-78 TaxID=1165861 RepID=A0A0L0VYA4_9BASI|nr:hypothetical protein Pst134EB_002156 [Puccinia striiformis f. sp. tritici]KNF04172.1 hypothetical protein PSTG_02523 [Puccinia striiformis f. sp. tritici PST-78]